MVALGPNRAAHNSGTFSVVVSPDLRHAETDVIAPQRQEDLCQVVIGFLQRRNTRFAEPFHQAVLQRSNTTLHTSLGLRRMGMNQLDAQLPARNRRTRADTAVPLAPVPSSRIDGSSAFLGARGSPPGPLAGAPAAPALEPIAR